MWYQVSIWYEVLLIQIIFRCILPIDGTLTDTDTTGFNGLEYNGTDGMFHISQSIETGVSIKAV